MSQIRPQPGPQTSFLACGADIAVYGGAAGGGKSFALLLEPLRHVHVPDFRAVVFRRNCEQVRMSGGLWEESEKLYPQMGGKPREARLEWTFPSGATVRFEHLQHEKDKLQFQGAQIALLGFDELTHFTESQFFYMLSRNRSTCGVRPYVRAATNPDATSWVKRFLAPWVDRHFPDPAHDGQTCHFVRDRGQIRWCEPTEPGAKSVAMFRATVFDNRVLLQSNPEYINNLKALPLIDRRRLLDGDWDVVETGNMFRREWFHVVDSPPPGPRLVRFWDLAATQPKPGSDPDYTVGVLMGVSADGTAILLDVARLRATPLTVETLVRRTAQMDAARYGRVAIRMEQEPGSSGIHTIDHYLRVVLAGFDFRGVRLNGGKAERARPLSALAESGALKLLAGAWNHDFVEECCAFPNPRAHDDQVDAAAGAHFCFCRQSPYNAVHAHGASELPDYQPR